MAQETLPVTVVALLPSPDDQARLREIFANSRWILHVADTLLAGRRLFDRAGPGVVIGADRLPDGGWKDVLYEAQRRSVPLIVAARLPDERLWAEVLNLGGFDLLPTPFETREVRRAVSLGWRYWRDRRIHGLASVA